MQQHLDIAHETGDRQGEGHALGNLGNTNIVLGEPRRASEYFQQALKIFLEIGDRRGESIALGNLVLSHVWNQRDRDGAVWFGRHGC